MVQIFKIYWLYWLSIERFWRYCLKQQSTYFLGVSVKFLKFGYKVVLFRLNILAKQTSSLARALNLSAIKTKASWKEGTESTHKIKHTNFLLNEKVLLNNRMNWTKAQGIHSVKNFSTLAENSSISICIYFNFVSYCCTQNINITTFPYIIINL